MIACGADGFVDVIEAAVQDEVGLEPTPAKRALGSALARNLTGISLGDFLRKFPDSDACFRHIFSVKYGDAPVCPQCGSSPRWYRVGSTQGFAPMCCFGVRVHPLSNTLFAKTRVPLHKWFYAMLHFCNTGAGIGAAFLARHLDVSTKAAVRMARQIRLHFRAIDNHVRLGGAGKIVHVYEDRMKKVIDPVNGSRNSMRILIASDTENFCIIAIPKGNFRSARALITKRLHPDSTIIFRDTSTYKKVSEYRETSIDRAARSKISTDPYSPQFMDLSVTVIRLKLYILSNHIWIRAENIDHYLAAFEFVYRRSRAGRVAFLDAIGAFPELDPPP
mgnify:FL=1